jgi:alpha-L-fucosidase
MHFIKYLIFSILPRTNFRLDMKDKKGVISFILLIGLSNFCNAQTSPDKMQWFRDAKLGIFIHWGIYAVDGVSESWSFHNREVTYADYMKQLDGFTAAKYNPQQWVELIKATGAGYAVLTTKHHDGVALYPTQLNDLTVIKKTPARRDLVTPFYEALRTSGIKVGAYYSLLDWSHPDYPNFLKDSGRYKREDDPARWAKFLAFCHGQINELNHLYRPDLWWFDGDWEQPGEVWQAKHIREMILQKHPGAILNSRLGEYGDYATPEQNMPITLPDRPEWELCMTPNLNWGYRSSDIAYKTPYELITIFADVVGRGGNLLFDIGPKADGTLLAEQVAQLQALARWNTKHHEAIFGTVAGLPEGHFYGPSTLTKDSTTLFLFLPAQPAGKVMIKGLVNGIERIEVVGAGQKLGHKVVGKISWSSVPGLVYIDAVPLSGHDQDMTVLKVTLNGKLQLYRGKGGF